MQKIIQYKEAKAKGLKRYFTGIPCCHGHMAEKLTSNRSCIKCSQIHYRNNSEKIKAKVKKWGENNKEYIKKYRKEHFQKNKEEMTEKNRIYREKNKDSVFEYHKSYREKHKNKIKNYMDNYFKKHREKIKKQKRQHYYDNQEKILKERKIWRKNNIVEARKIRNRYKRTTPEQKLIHSMRSIMHKCFKYNKSIKDIRTLELLGCNSIKFLKQYIQKRFEKGMSWKNYGKWHIDHIIPINYFLTKCNFNSLRIQKKCFNYKNLQPMWAVDNLRKGYKII